MLWRPTKSRNPYNVKPFLTDISATVAQIQKFQKTRCIFFFQILLLLGPSPPSQMVPNPFNWSPNTVLHRYRSLKSKSSTNFKYALGKKIRHYLGIFPNMGWGGLPNSQNFCNCKLTKYFFVCQIHFEVLKHVLQRGGGDI